MKNRLRLLIDKILLRKRSIIETINDELKNIAHTVHTQHKGVENLEAVLNYKNKV